MKKIISGFLLVSMLILLVSCASNGGNAAETTAADTAVTAENKIDIDLTLLSSTMAYSEVYNMNMTPESYIGKTVKMKGPFAIYEDPNTNIVYFACTFADTTACCSQAIEFMLDGEHKYPDDYPEVGAEITVTGIFGTYEEDSGTYCRLNGAKIVE